MNIKVTNIGQIQNEKSDFFEEEAIVAIKKLFEDNKTSLHDSGSGFGGSEGLDLSSGKGINSLLSDGGNIIRPSFQSSLACSMRSLREETKFHQMKRSPNGSPPNSIRVVFSFARTTGSAPGVNISIWPS